MSYFKLQQQASLYLLVIFLSFFSSCQTMEKDPIQGHARITQVNTYLSSFIEPKFEISSCRSTQNNRCEETHHSIYSLSAIKKPLSKSSIEVDEKLKSLDKYEQAGRKMFWVGLGGLAVSLVSNSKDAALGRTAGNTIWAVGWMVWLGLSAVADAGYHDLNGYEFNATLAEGKSLESSALDVTPLNLSDRNRFGDSTERDGFFVFNWTISKF